MSGLQPQTGWSVQGPMPPRVTSMTYIGSPKMERSTMNAIGAKHGFLKTSSWVKQSHTLVLPVPTFPFGA